VTVSVHYPWWAAEAKHHQSLVVVVSRRRRRFVGLLAVLLGWVGAIVPLPLLVFLSHRAKYKILELSVEIVLGWHKKSRDIEHAVVLWV